MSIKLKDKAIIDADTLDGKDSSQFALMDQIDDLSTKVDNGIDYKILFTNMKSVKRLFIISGPIIVHFSNALALNTTQGYASTGTITSKAPLLDSGWCGTLSYKDLSSYKHVEIHTSEDGITFTKQTTNTPYTVTEPLKNPLYVMFKLHDSTGVEGVRVGIANITITNSNKVIVSSLPYNIATKDQIDDLDQKRLIKYCSSHRRKRYI